MLKYNDYLKAACSYYEFLNEDEFNEIVKKFNINSIDYSSFEFGEMELEYYIINKLLIEKFGDCLCIDDFYNNEVNVEFYSLETQDILDDVKEFLESFGYTFVNYDSLKEKLLEKQETDDAEELYQKAKLLIDDFSSDELKEFIEKCGVRRQYLW